jgi:hypothetical protein
MQCNAMQRKRNTESGAVTTHRSVAAADRRGPWNPAIRWATCSRRSRRGAGAAASCNKTKKKKEGDDVSVYYEHKKLSKRSDVKREADEATDLNLSGTLPFSL